MLKQEEYSLAELASSSIPLLSQRERSEIFDINSHANQFTYLYSPERAASQAEKEASIVNNNSLG